MGDYRVRSWVCEGCYISIGVGGLPESEKAINVGMVEPADRRRVSLYAPKDLIKIWCVTYKIGSKADQTRYVMWPGPPTAPWTSLWTFSIDDPLVADVANELKFLDLVNANHYQSISFSLVTLLGSEVAHSSAHKIGILQTLVGGITSISLWGVCQTAPGKQLSAQGKLVESVREQRVIDLLVSIWCCDCHVGLTDNIWHLRHGCPIPER